MSDASSARATATAALTGLLLALTACATEPAPSPSPSASPIPAISAGAGEIAPTEPGPSVVEGAALARVDAREDWVTGLAAPWDIAWEPHGTPLISLRDQAKILRVDGATVTELTGAGADDLQSALYNAREAGLLGLALHPDDPTLLFAYVTRDSGNTVVRMEVSGDTLGPATVILSGIPKAHNHDGGRIRFGPDGYLYIATGDAANKPLAQDLDSLAGKILRVVADGGANDGEAAPGNPFGTRIWSWGHRNVQGLGWSPDGRMFASELGQNEQDELNQIVAGANYGWPTVEGLFGSPNGTELGATVEGLTYPVATWPTDQASPSGIAVTDEAIYMGALRGSRVWRIPLVGQGVGTPHVLLDDLGRIRAVSWGPDGALYVMTSNTDGNGGPRDGDDRIVRVTVEEVA